MRLVGAASFLEFFMLSRIDDCNKNWLGNIGYIEAMTQPVSAPKAESAQPSKAARDVLSGEGGPVERAIAIMDLLRSPDGCPWDREQTFDSIKRHTLEETYEVFDAIERRIWPELKDELGDLLLQVLFYAQMAKEAGYFDILDVAANLNEKLVRRHPHIFAGVEATDADAVLKNWERIKREEKATDDGVASLLADIPRSMPAMLEAAKLGSRAAKVGFDWPDATGLVDKLREEMAELEAEIDGPGTASGAAEEELGDLLFTAANLARHLRVDAESALRGANGKFRRRFGAMEAEAGGADALGKCSPEDLNAMWGRAKAATAGARRS